MKEKDLKDLAEKYEYATTKFEKAEMIANTNIANTLSENRMDNHMSKLEESILNDIRDEKKVDVLSTIKDKFNELFGDVLK